jgi:hypothetical protein
LYVIASEFPYHHTRCCLQQDQNIWDNSNSGVYGQCLILLSSPAFALII